MPIKFSNIKACVFDAYGTLFDVHSAVGKHRAQIETLTDPDKLSALWRTKQLEYTWLRSLMKRHVDFWQVTRDGLEFACDTCDVRDEDLKTTLMDAYLKLECYPEVPGVLKQLQDVGLKTAVLSNGSPMMLEAANSNSGIAPLLDEVFSVESAGIFKPDPSVYQLVLDGFGIAADEVSFQSSNAWDAAAAGDFGFRVAWCNRFGQRRERIPAPPDAELRTLAELPAIVI